MTTDNDIPISCGECPPNTYVEGIEDMVQHILDNHKNYTPQEAEEYAVIWMRSAYEDIAQQEMEWVAEYRQNRRVS